MDCMEAKCREAIRLQIQSFLEDEHKWYDCGGLLVKLVLPNGCHTKRTARRIEAAGLYGDPDMGLLLEVEESGKTFAKIMKEKDKV